MLPTRSLECRLCPLVKVNSGHFSVTSNPSLECSFYPQNLWITLWIPLVFLPRGEGTVAILLHWLLFDHLILAGKYSKIQSIPEY